MKKKCNSQITLLFLELLKKEKINNVADMKNPITEIIISANNGIPLSPFDKIKLIQSTKQHETIKKGFCNILISLIVITLS